MTDPIPGQPAPEGDVAAELKAKQDAAEQAGVTEVDVQALIKAMQEQLEAQAAAIAELKAKAGPQGEHPLVSTAVNLRYHLGDMAHSDAHQPAIALADDLVEASKAAAESGDLSNVTSIMGRLERWARRVKPRPGDDHHGYQAAEIIAAHLPDQVDAFAPLPRRPGIATTQPPAKVLAGSVIAG